MKRAVIELAILLILMVLAGTAYMMSQTGERTRHLAWVNPLLPTWPPCRIQTGDQGKGRENELAKDTGTAKDAGAPKETGATKDTGSDRHGDTGTTPPPTEGFRFIEHAEVFDYFKGGEALFIDARKTKEYEDGHITGAISISYWEEDAQKKISALKTERPPEAPIVIYCTRSKDCEDSQHIALQLSQLGFLDLMVYRGGFPEWLEKEPQLVTKGSSPGEKPGNEVAPKGGTEPQGSGDEIPAENK